MKIQTLTTTGTKETEIELPLIFSTPFRKDLIHKAVIHLTTNQLQKCKVSSDQDSQLG